MSTNDTTEHDKLHRTIVALEDQQRSFGPDLTQQIAELRRRLKEVETFPQSSSSVAATFGGTAAGAGGIAVDGHVFMESRDTRQRGGGMPGVSLLGLKKRVRISYYSNALA